MASATRQIVIVKPGGVIEIRDPQLPEGAVAEVIVLVEVPAVEVSNEAAPLSPV